MAERMFSNHTVQLRIMVPVAIFLGHRDLAGGELYGRIVTRTLKQLDEQKDKDAQRGAS